MLLACCSHKHISYRIRTIIRKAISFLDPSVSYSDDKKRSTGMTAVLRHTAIHSRYL
ncbi:hypothetical protein [Wolbachia endosymbiont (group A) of Aleiodes leptofemur]|uniref:hypothetical protein n=1 Tax=Wolbachia endosymbiont (group A) of Aleiodes leptofemur TaxID=3077919 RepID=UPI00334060F1